VSQRDDDDYRMIAKLVDEADKRQPPVDGKCPDGGTCHHGCFSSCFRVEFCAPLSGVFPRNRWPRRLRRA